jgi:protein-tyrosine phosphatase
LAGQQRSPAVVCAYLMEYEGYTLDGSIRYIREKKKDAFFWQINFWVALHKYATVLGK